MLELLVPRAVLAPAFPVELRLVVDEREWIVFLITMSEGGLIVRDEGHFSPCLVLARLEDIVDGSLVFLRVFREGSLEGFAVELELLRLGLELSPAFLELVGRGVPHASVDELPPPVDLVAAHVFFSVPERGRLDLQVILGELEAVVRHFARLGVFELVPQVIVKVGEPPFLELDGQIPDDLGLVHSRVPHGFDHG